MAAHETDQPSSVAEKVWPGKAVADLPGAAVSMVASATSQTSEVFRLPPSHHHPRAPPSPRTDPASKPTSITAHLTTHRPLGQSHLHRTHFPTLDDARCQFELHSANGIPAHRPARYHLVLPDNPDSRSLRPTKRSTFHSSFRKYHPARGAKPSDECRTRANQAVWKKLKSGLGWSDSIGDGTHRGPDGMRGCTARLASAQWRRHVDSCRSEAAFWHNSRPGRSLAASSAVDVPAFGTFRHGVPDLPHSR